VDTEQQRKTRHMDHMTNNESHDIQNTTKPTRDIYSTKYIYNFFLYIKYIFYKNIFFPIELL